MNEDWILIVDDDASVRYVYEAAVGRDGFQVLSVASGMEALHLLKEHDFAALVVDYAMPEMDGLSFLLQAKILRPNATRIMISGNFGTSVVIEAINRGQVFRFLPKPCSLSGLVETVRAAVRFHRIFSANQIESLQRRETLALISAGIVHDLNNFLCTIRGNVTLLQEHLGLDEFQKERVLHLDTAAMHASEICQKLLKQHRPAPGEPQVHNFHDIIDQAVVLAKAVLSRNVKLELEVCPGIPHVRIDETAAVQMLLNLLFNANDAMPNGGTVTVSTEMKKAPSEAHFLECYVADAGTGMPRAMLQQIFEPYFSTKPTGQGTGLGLWTVKATITRAGGSVRVESTIGKGTVFHLSLPIEDRCVDAAK